MNALKQLVAQWRDTAEKSKRQACYSVVQRQQTAQLNDAWAREDCADQLEAALKELEAEPCKPIESSAL